MEKEGEENECKYYGYWDHLAGPDKGKGLLEHVSVGKSFGAASAEASLEQGLKTIVSISHSLKANESLEEWRRKLKGHAKIIKSYPPDSVAYILIMDEPFLKEFTVGQLETMTEEAREIIGTEYSYGYNFTIGTVKKRKLPQNVDIASINIYPFFENSFLRNTVKTRSDFERFFTDAVQVLKQKAPNSQYFITGQAFYLPGKWRTPPVESPLWYAEAINNDPDILGILWFEWRDRGKWKGTKSMPDLYENQKKAFEILCPDG